MVFGLGHTLSKRSFSSACNFAAPRPTAYPPRLNDTPILISIKDTNSELAHAAELSLRGEEVLLQKGSHVSALCRA